MGLRDNAIVAYAETKVMKKSDRDVWVLAGEILESLLDKTGFEKAEIDGLVMSGLPMSASTTAATTATIAATGPNPMVYWDRPAPSAFCSAPMMRSTASICMHSASSRSRNVTTRS